jgi:flagellar hook-associated protein 1 FlgK
MSSIFGGLSTAISGIIANRRALDTISHNISNVNNPNYVRQQAIHAASRHSKLPNEGFSVGTGVDVQEIRQIRDEFLDIKYRDGLKEYGLWSAKNSVFEEVQSIFNELSNNGLQSVMDQFWNGWEELSKDPDNLTLRGLLKERAVAFVETVNHMSKQLDDLKFNLNKEIENKVNEINSIAKRISELNGNIQAAETKNVKANDYRDERNSLLDRLSQIIGIDYYEDTRNTVNVSIGGKYLVSETDYSEIEGKKIGSPYVSLYWKDQGDEKVSIEGGELLGYIEARDEIIPNIKDRLDTFVKTIADKVNEVHKQGYTLEGDPGDDFFVPPSDITAGTIKLNDNLSTLNNIAASSEEIDITNERGNGEIAAKIASVRNEYFADLDNMTLDEYYRDIISELGVQGNEAATMEESQRILIMQVDERRKSISGVSLDEEMAEMLKFQHSYVANTRVVNAIDEMMDNIINKMGVVGR